MNDGIIKDDGTSRLLRSVSDFKSKYPTYDEFADALVNGSLPVDVLFNGAGWAQQPDFLDKASLLKDTTASLFQLGTDAVPDEVLAVLSKAALVGEDDSLTLPNGDKVKSVSIESGSYVGTGTWGASNPNSLSFSGKPEIVSIFGYGRDPAGFRAVSIINGMDNMDHTNGFSFASITWEGNKVSWYANASSNGGPYQANDQGRTYLYAGVIVR